MLKFIKHHWVENIGYYVGVLTLVFSIQLFQDGYAAAAWTSVVLGSLLVILGVFLTWIKSRERITR